MAQEKRNPAAIMLNVLGPQAMKTMAQAKNATHDVDSYPRRENVHTQGEIDAKKAAHNP